MSFEKIKKDAEDLRVRGSKVIRIGEKIKKKMPKYQFMGLIKIMNKDFLKLKKFYKKIDKNIDFTSFLNLAIKKNIVNLKYIKTNIEWYEIDNLKDLKHVESVNFKW